MSVHTPDRATRVDDLLPCRPACRRLGLIVLDASSCFRQLDRGDALSFHSLFLLYPPPLPLLCCEDILAVDDRCILPLKFWNDNLDRWPLKLPLLPLLLNDNFFRFLDKLLLLLILLPLPSLFFCLFVVRFNMLFHV